MKRKHFILALVAMLSCFTFTANAQNAAKVGNTEYATIDEAIAAWTNNTTLTLLSNVTLSDVVTLKSTEHHILNLGTYTMTAASGKNAFVIKACGNGSAERTAITINADATNPGGINAGSKCVVYYKYADGGISTEDRPIIKINGGVFTGSTSSWGTAGIYTIGTAARKCATLDITGGTFNCTINGSGKSKLIISGGVFNYSVGSQGDSTALRLISGGTFKTFGFMTADSNNTKFWFGTSMGNSNVGVYVDDNGCIVVGGAVVTEAGDKFEASSSNYSSANSLLQYSSAKNNGLYYTSVEEALADNNTTSGKVTVYVDELDMTGISYKGTIVVPEGNDITITNAPSTLKVQLKDGTVLTPDANGTVATKFEVATLDELQTALASTTNVPIVITAQIEIPAGETVELDLNGKTVNSVFNGTSTTNHIYALNNKGTLAINDSKGNGSINSRGIYNYGSLTLNAGAINAIDGNGGYAVNNQSGSTFVMNGGVVAATNEDDHQSSSGGYDATALKVPAGCTATLNGGTINNVCDFTFAIDAAGTLNIPATSTITVNGTHGAIYVSGGETTINAGTFQIPADNYSRTDNVLYVSGGSLVVNGGTFIGDSDTAGGGSCLYDTAGKAVVNGGTFKGSSGGDVWGTTGTTIKGGTFENLTEKQHIAAGYELKDGTVVEKKVAEINGVEYATLAAAVAAVQEGETITLIDNVVLAERVTIPADKTLTIDLNGKSISMEESIIATAYAINNLGNLTITDGVGGGSINARGIYNGYGDGAANVATAKITVLSGTINAKGTNGGAAVYNYGIAEIKGGTFTSIGGYSLNSQSGASMTIADGVTANNGIYVSGATLVVDGGEISGNRSGCHVLYAWNSTVTINGGEFYNNNSGNSTTMAAGTTELTINGGTFGIKDGRVPGNGNTWTSCLTDTQNSATMTVNGGTFNGGFRVQGGTTMTIAGGEFNDCYGSGYNIYGTAEVKGGTFTDAAAQTFAKNNIADDYKLGEDGKVVYAPVVAKIGETKYETLEAAFAAAAEGATITLLADATPALTSQRAITKAAVIDLGGKTLTLKEDDLYFGTTTFKNGTIVVDPSVKPSTAVFWMFANQTLTFDNVKIVATGVTGTYLIGLEGDNSDLNLLNGSEILVENTTALDLDIICVNGKNTCDIKVDNSKVNVTNIDGRVFFRGNYTVKDSEVNLAGITKAGFRIEAGQKLSIEGTSVVNIEGEPRDGGIHMTDLSATYTKAETATVTATVNEPKVAKVGDNTYRTLAQAVAAVEDGGTITLIANETFTETNRTHNSGTWYDGLYYVGDKSFTIDLGGFTISQDGAVNDYLLNFKNSGSKANTITLKNGTLDAGTTAFCAICTSSSQANELTINTENINIINNISNGSTIKLRGGAVLNVNGGTKITGKNSYLGIECVASTVNIYDGAEIYMNGTTSYNGCLVGACGGGTVNVYGGYGKGVKGGFIAMTSGGTINVAGGEWIANTDGTVGNNSNLYVLTAQSNKYESGFVGASIINVTGGTLRGGMDAWVLNNIEGEKAELNITGGNFNANPTRFVEEGYVATEAAGIYTVVEAPAYIDGKASYASLAAAYEAAVNGDVIVLNESVTTFPVIKKAVTFKGGKENAAVEINYALSQNFTAIDGTVRFENLTFNKPLFTEHGGNKPGLSIEFEGCNFNVNSEAGYGILIGTSWSNSVVKGLKVNNCNFEYVGTEFKGGYMLYVQCVNEVTITNNTIDGNNLYRGAIHLGDATEHATVATVSNNTIKNFCRGVMMGNRVAGSSATISGNTFDNINYSDKDSKPAQECAPIFIHSNATAAALQVALTDNKVENCANPMIYSEDTDLIKYYVTEFTGNTVAGSAVELANSYNAPNQIFPVATINDAEYFTLQAAVNAVKNGETIKLILDIEENVTLTEKTGLYYTIDGDGKTMTGTITVSSLSDTNDNRRITIKNINFVDTVNGRDFITSTATNHYPRITVEGCSFTGTGKEAANSVAVRLKSSHSVVIKDCTGTGLHSFLQNTSGWNLTIENVTVTNSKSGLALGTVQGVTVKGCEIAAEGYGIRLDAGYNNNAVIESNKVEAFIPVVVRKATVDSNITVKGENEFAASNTDGLWCAIGTSEYEANGEMPTTATGKVKVVVNSNLPQNGLYGNHKEGSLSAAYVGETGYWGECGGNANYSFELKFYNDDTFMGSTSLNDVDNIIDGDVYVTWNMILAAKSNTDNYWTMSWTVAPTVAEQPNRVEQWVDGVKVAECAIQLNGPDNLNPIVAAAADAGGVIKSFATSFDAAVATAQAGETVAILKAGTYSIAGITGKNITITGAVEGVEFANIAAHNMGGASVTFNNVTFTYAANSTYKGLQHSGNLVYNNCTFNGQVFLYGQSETFNGCTFNTEDSNNYNVWTYGAKNVAFNECTFNSAGKSVLIYAESASITNNVTVSKSEFIASQAVEGKAAIEMDSSLSGAISLTIDGETTATGFGTGNVSGNSLWNNKKGNSTDANNDITVEVGNETVLAPVTFVAKIGEIGFTAVADAIKAAQAGETVTILAGEYTGGLTVNKAITVEGAVDAEGNNLVAFSGTLSIKANGATVKNLNFTNTSGKAASVNAKDVVIDGCSLVGSNGLYQSYTSGLVTFKNSYIKGGTYGINFDGNAGGEIVIENCTVIGWTSFAKTIKKVTMTGTTFAEGNYNYVRLYQENVEISGCTFNEKMSVDLAVAGAQVSVSESTYGNKNIENLFASDDVNNCEIIVDGNKLLRVAQIGANNYATLVEAIAAAQDGDVIKLVTDITMDYGAREAFETSASAVVINGNGKTLTLNQTNSDWSSFGLANGSKLVLNDMTINKSGKGATSGAWNTHAIIFSCPVEMTDVTVNNSVAVQAGATLNNVAINEANGYYGLWINGNGQKVTVNGGSITATNGGRGIKIADQYIATPAQVELNVDGTVFNTAKKAAVLVSSTAGAKIAANNVDIANVAEDNVNFVWVDEDWAANYGNVEVTGAPVAQEGAESFTTAITENGAVKSYYKTLAAAVKAAQNGETVELLANVTLAGGYEDATEGLRIEKEITLNGNNHTINCGNFQKGIRIYNPSNVGDFNVNFNNVKVVNNVANGRCIDTRSGNINLKVNSSTLIATNGNSQPLTIGGNDPVHRVTLNGTTIDAGTSGYAVISFVSTNVDIQGVNNSTISGFAAFYLKGDAKTTNLNLGQGVYTGTNNHAVESGLFGTVVLEGDNNVVNLMGTNATVKAIANNTAPQAAFLVIGANNIIKVTKESAKIITEGNAYEAMVKADNAATTKFVDMGIERKLVAENRGYQFYSFEEAVRFAGNEGTIKIVNDFELAEAWTIPADKKYTLDLNGKTVTMVYDEDATANHTMINNLGDLTIKSSVEGGKLSYTYTGKNLGTTYAANTITSEPGSVLTVKSGTIENLTFDSGVIAYAIDGRTNGGAGDVTVNIEGGVITSKRQAVRIFANSTTNTGALNISGGDFTGRVIVQNASAKANKAALNITGGTFNANEYKTDVLYVGGSSSAEIDINATVSGGTFNGEITDTNVAGFIRGGTFANPVAAQFCAEGYMPNKNANGTYGVVAAQDAVAAVGGFAYTTLAEAVKACVAGDNTIELLADCAENVTIAQKNGTNIVINGNGKTYSGTITVKGDKVANNLYNTETLTFQNIIFAPAYNTYAITAEKNTYARNITVDGCTFMGNNDVYGIRVRNGYNYTVKNTTAEGVYTFFNASEALVGLTVEDVTVKCANVAFAGAYGFGDASFKEVTVESDNNGVKVNNPNGSALTFEDCSIKAKTPVTFIENAGVTSALTAEFNGTNTMVVNNGGTYWFNIVEADATDATFKAIVNDANLDMSNTAFAASVGNVYYSSLQKAIDEADGGATVVIARDIELDAANCVKNSDGYSVFVNVAGKAITIDLNGKAITANLSADQFASAKSSLLMAVFSVDTNGNLTLNDSKGTGKVAVTANDASVYSLISNYDKTAKLTINDGSYELDKARAQSSLIHSDPSEAVVVNGGNFYLGNVNTGVNNSPWIFNVNGSNTGHVIVNGGTFNYDINHQYWAFEVHVDKALALQNNGNGTWTVVPAVAYVIEENNGYTREAGYATLEEAVASKYGNVVTLLTDVTLADALVVEDGMDVTVKGEDKTITGCDGKDVFYVKGGKLTLTEGLNVHATTDCAIYLRGGDVFTAANLTKSGDKYHVIQGNGNYTGNVTITGGKVEHQSAKAAIYWPQNGKLTITGGEITGHSAVYIASGSLEITGGTLHGVGANGEYSGVTGGSTDSPAEALTIENVGGNSGYELISSVVITGGTFISDNAKAVGSYANTTLNPDAEPVAGFISGGIFNTPVEAAHCATNYAPYNFGDGTWGVEYLCIDELTINDDEYYDYVYSDFENQNNKTVGTLTYKRTLGSDDYDWNALYVPFEIPVSMLTNMGLQVAYMNDVRSYDKNSDGEIDEMVMESFLIKSGTLNANHPYFFRRTRSASAEINLQLSNVTLYSTAAENQTVVTCSSAYTEFILGGTYSMMTEAQLDGRLILGVDNETGLTTWVKIDPYWPLSAFRLHLTIKQKNGSPVKFNDAAMRAIRIRVIGEENENGETIIYDVEMDDQTVDYIYDLQGRRVLEPQKGNLYIINGKKVIF